MEMVAKSNEWLVKNSDLNSLNGYLTVINNSKNRFLT